MANKDSITAQIVIRVTATLISAAVLSYLSLFINIDQLNLFSSSKKTDKIITVTPQPRNTYHPQHKTITISQATKAKNKDSLNNNKLPENEIEDIW